MNEYIEQIKNNLYTITDEFGTTRIVSSINFDNITSIENIVKKENEIQEIENKIKNQERTLETLNKINIHAEIINILTYILLVLLIITIKPTSILKTIILGASTISSYTFLKTLNCALLGTRKGRKKQKNQINTNIEELHILLDETKKEYEQLKEENKFTVLTTTKPKKNKYEFKHQSISQKNSNNKPLTRKLKK